MIKLKIKKNKETKKPNILKYKGFEIKSGDLVEGSIYGKFCIGRILIENSYLYFCQDIQDGDSGSTNLGFKYSWSFWALDEDELTDSVKIFKHFSNENTLKEGSEYKTFNVENEDQRSRSISNLYIQYLVSGYIKDHLVTQELYKKRIPCFKITNHPDCCGSKILFNFDSSKSEEYSSYKKLDDEDISRIKDYLQKIKAAKIVHLAEYQKPAIKFVEKLGFELQFEYKNYNSNNTIFVYHLNYSENSES